MARVLKNSRLNPRKGNADTAYNRAVNRGSDKSTILEVEDQPPVNTDQKHGGRRVTKDTAGQG